MEAAICRYTKIEPDVDLRVREVELMIRGIRHLATAAVLVAFWFTLALAQAAPSDEEVAMASLQSLAARCQAGLVRKVSVHPDSDKYWRRTIYQRAPSRTRSERPNCWRSPTSG